MCYVSRNLSSRSEITSSFSKLAGLSYFVLSICYQDLFGLGLQNLSLRMTCSFQDPSQFPGLIQFCPLRSHPGFYGQTPFDLQVPLDLDSSSVASRNMKVLPIGLKSPSDQTGPHLALNLTFIATHLRI